MEEKREVIRSYVSQGLKLDTCLAVVNLSRSTYYYKSNGKRKGKKPSTHTLFNGTKVPNEKVVIRIKQILEPEFIDYGYKRTTDVLKEEGYQIGKSKVYRLMKENHLLNKQIKTTHPGKRFTVYNSPQPDRPFKILELDFKYIWIEGARKNAYLLTILDTFHRQAYVWTLNYDMKTERVIELIMQFVDDFLIPNDVDPKLVELCFRTDNGCQFTSFLYQRILKEIGIRCTYIPKATPQLNGHIEAFHSTIERLVCKKYSFISLKHSKDTFERFYNTYNKRRIMKAILSKRPVQFFNLWREGKIGFLKVRGVNKFFLKEERQLELTSHP